MNIRHRPTSLKAQLDSILESAATRNNSATMEDAMTSTAKIQRRDRFLDKLSTAQQVEILKWAENQGIRPDDPLWLLVDMIGYTKFMTETLPSQMRAAGQQAVDAIAQQRRAEADFFSENAQIALNKMLSTLTDQVAQASETLTEAKLRKKLWHQGLWAATGMTILSAMCFIFGYTFGNAHLDWIDQYNPNAFIRIAQVILGLPIGYLLIPVSLTVAILILIDEITQWREQRHKWQTQNHQWH